MGRPSKSAAEPRTERRAMIALVAVFALLLFHPIPQQTVIADVKVGY